MPILESGSLQLPERYLEMVRAMLRQYVPQAEVWAYGSRVNGTGHEASDLDLVVRNPSNLAAETRDHMSLKTAFIESRLPIRVDVLDWALLPPKFRSEIEREHVVVQQGGLE